MKTISVDYEHNCTTWWDAAREEISGNPPTSCIGLVSDVISTDAIVCSDEDADEFVAWAEQLDGWAEQPFVIQ